MPEAYCSFCLILLDSLTFFSVASAALGGSFYERFTHGEALFLQLTESCRRMATAMPRTRDDAVMSMKWLDGRL